jgi:ribonuclease-3
VAEQGLEERLGYHFRDADLLRRALTHRSHGQPHNERLEFLGDSVVNCAVALELHQRFPDLSEGDLSRLRANLVNQSSLHGIALGLQLGEVLRLGDGELRSGGAQRPSILADALEAIAGAALLDGGFPAVQSVVRRLFSGALSTIDPRASAKDAKTLLQELLQGRGLALPVYALLATRGQAHAQTFEVQCQVEPLGIRTEGSGGSRRAAEQEAARKAYQELVRR